MKRFLFLVLVLFMLTGCKYLMLGTYEVREPTPEDIALAEASLEEDQEAAEQSERSIGVGLINVTEGDGSPSGWVKKITFTNGTTSISGADATVTIAGVNPGDGSMTTVQELDSSIGDADIVTLDFQTGFYLSEAPDTEVNVELDVTPSSGNATLVLEEDALQVKYDSTDLAEGASGLTLATNPTVAGIMSAEHLTSTDDADIQDDLQLDSDSAILALGEDQDVLITHVADTGINLTTTAATSGVFNLGNDDDSNDDSIDLIIHDSGIIQMYDANDDTSITLAVGDGTTVLSLTGSLTASATVTGEHLASTDDAANLATTKML
jgi:hypothetical protein